MKEENCPEQVVLLGLRAVEASQCDREYREGQ